MRRRGTKGSEVVIAPRDDAVVAVGQRPGIEAFIQRARSIIESSHLPEAAQLATNLKSMIDSLPKKGDTGPLRFEFSPDSIDLLRRHGAIATEDGFFRSMVHDGKNYAGNLDWKPVAPGPDLLALQTAALGLALDASLKQLADAVSRVENRVDELRDLVRTGQIGEVLAHHRVIRRLLDLTDPDDAGRPTIALSDTDWNSIDQYRGDIIGALERTRLFIRSRIDAAQHGKRVRTRVEAAEVLVQADIADALGLLATSTHNLVGWHRLRLDRIRRTEPHHLDSVIADIEAGLVEQTHEDQSLADALASFTDRLAEPTGYEGLEPLQRRELIGHIETIRNATDIFVRQRHLRSPSSEVGELPGVRDSLANAKAALLMGSRLVRERGATVSRSAASRARASLPRRSIELPADERTSDRLDETN